MAECPLPSSLSGGAGLARAESVPGSGVGVSDPSAWVSDGPAAWGDPAPSQPDPRGRVGASQKILCLKAVVRVDTGPSVG